LRRAREEGLPFTAETTPHYLHFAAEDIPDGATPYKCAPPIRERENREKLWAALREGVIDLVVSDHSPCTPALKKLEAGDFEAAWGGIASLQLGLPVIWTEARARGNTIADLAKWMCEGSAKLAGLGAKKGRIAAGLDADLVIWDPEATHTVRAAEIQHKHKITPYAGETLFGTVSATFLRGECVFEAGSFPGSARGLVIRRS
jgi:allantoinase